ncbi:uncharacterized protein BKA78DRAFT_294491 [Phyllosticta capitalensis]|uniref:uncharacterized protein n=1 Tax=Phyllosticta capitalensis TaxID=121624 RepID=UPI00312EB2E4
MSALRNFSRVAAAAAPRTNLFAAQRMGFQTSALRLAGKESTLTSRGHGMTFSSLAPGNIPASPDPRPPSLALSSNKKTEANTGRPTDQEGRAEEAEAHKQDQLRKQKQGKGHWKDELASDSESAVKADRGEVDASSDTIQKLQKEGEKLASKKK